MLVGWQCLLDRLNGTVWVTAAGPGRRIDRIGQVLFRSPWISRATPGQLEGLIHECSYFCREDTRAVNFFQKAARVPIQILNGYPGTRSKISLIFLLLVLIGLPSRAITDAILQSISTDRALVIVLLGTKKLMILGGVALGWSTSSLCSTARWRLIVLVLPPFADRISLHGLPFVISQSSRLA